MMSLSEMISLFFSLSLFSKGIPRRLRAGGFPLFDETLRLPLPADIVDGVEQRPARGVWAHQIPVARAVEAVFLD